VSLLTPLAPDPHAAVARFNPVAKLAAAVVVLVGLVVTSDPLTPSLLLASHRSFSSPAGSSPRCASGSRT